MADERVVFITGGGRGIGAATAKRFAATGDKVVITARTAEQLESTAGDIRQAGGQVLAVRADMGQDENVAAAADRAAQTFGRIDVLINNAATSAPIDPFTTPPDEFSRILNINLVGYYRAVHYCLPHMTAPGGVIINISSIMGFMASGNACAYVASKGGIESLTYDLAVRLGPEGIRVVNLRFGAIDTSGTQTWVRSADALDAMGKHFYDLCPLDRSGTVDEAADVLIYLASPQAGYIHGSTVTVDGGRMAAMYPKSINRVIREGNR